MKYVVVEIQSGDSIGVLTNSYDTLAEAESKYFSILSYAAKSTILKHSAVVLDDEGRLIHTYNYDRTIDNSFYDGKE